MAAWVLHCRQGLQGLRLLCDPSHPQRKALRMGADGGGSWKGHWGEGRRGEQKQ